MAIIPNGWLCFRRVSVMLYGPSGLPVERLGVTFQYYLFVTTRRYGHNYACGV